MHFAKALKILASFKGRPFTTTQFASMLRRLYPATWKRLVSRYGRGGKRCGRHYSVYTYLGAAVLNRLAHSGQIAKVGYRPASPTFGSPVEMIWG